VQLVILVAAVVAYVVLAGLAVFQIALAAGAPLGRLAWGGQHRVLPTGLRIGSAVSVLVYGVMAWIIASAVDGPTAALWVITVYFGIGILANAISRSRPERFVQTPVAALLCGCCLVIALA
jgi:hypothetical protein